MNPQSLSRNALERLIILVRGGVISSCAIRPAVWTDWWDLTQEIIRTVPKENTAFKAPRMELEALGLCSTEGVSQKGCDLAVETCAILLLCNGIANLGKI